MCRPKEIQPNDVVSLEPVQTAAASLPEFGRLADLQRLFGIKRGTAYNLLRQGKIKGVVLQVNGQKSGVRLFDLTSVRQHLRQLAGQADQNQYSYECK